MPVPPPDQPNEPHQAREMAESFGVDAERYDRARPDYPSALIDQIVAVMPGPEVLDVGCGTGISSRLLQARGCRVLGLDVDERMAAFARTRGTSVEVARFEDWDPAGRVFDAVVAAQTWHWIDPIAGPIKAAKLLRPGGVLAMWWNTFELPPEPAEAIAEANRRILPEIPMAHGGLSQADAYRSITDKVAKGITDAGDFTEPQFWRHPWTREYRRDEWLDQLPTTGIYTRLPEAKRDELLAAVGEIIDRYGGSLTVKYQTVTVLAHLR